MVNPRLNLPLLARPISDVNIEHLVRTLREWSRYVTAALGDVDATRVRNSGDEMDGTLTIALDEDEPNLISDRTGDANFNGAIHASIRSAGTEIGRITRATSTTAGFLTTSDADLKENFALIDEESSYLWMRTIRPYFFNYKDDPDVRHVGYNAQEVAQQWPNGVANGVITPGWGDVEDRTWDEDGNETTPREVWQAWMMDHSKITPILHACLQTVDATLEERGAILVDHEARIADLEATVAAQAAQIADLTQALADLRTEIYYTRQMTAYWQYSSTTTPPPGGGQMRTNPALSQMYLHKTDADGYNRDTTMAFIIAATAQQPDGVRLRVRGTTGRVLELRSNGLAIDSGSFITLPIRVISGDTSDRGFRVEIAMFSEIWAEDPPA